MKPLVSVIIPCYNNASYIGECIESVLTQSYQPVETILVNDGSTDESEKIIEKYRGELKYFRQHKSGAGAARNYGLSMADGEYVIFLDADDILLENCIEMQVNHAKTLPDGVFAFGCHKKYYEETGRISDIIRPPVKSGDCVSFAWLFSPGPRMSAPLYTKGAIEEVGGFDEGLSYGQEHDLNIRLALSGYRFSNSGVLVFLQRMHGSRDRISNMPRKGFNKFDSIPEMERILERASGKLSEAQLAEFEVALARFAWRMGRLRLAGERAGEAETFFGFARNLGGEGAVAGGLGYRIAIRCVGPRVAEKIGELKMRCAGRAAGPGRIIRTRPGRFGHRH